jgi:Asp-tRNA(Asn)/Glu-tRNA(Gln) amidotransferase A subunit family amidase
MHSMIRPALSALLVLGGTTQPAHAQDFDVMEATIAGTHDALRDGRTTCRGIVQQYLARIAAYDQVGPTLNAIQHVNARARTASSSSRSSCRGRSVWTA